MGDLVYGTGFKDSAVHGMVDLVYGRGKKTDAVHEMGGLVYGVGCPIGSGMTMRGRRTRNGRFGDTGIMIMMCAAKKRGLSLAV